MANIIAKRGRGRPKVFKADLSMSILEPQFETNHPQKLLELLSKGTLNTGCMAELGISKDTFYRWIREYKDFKAAYEIGRPRCEYFHAKKLQEMTDERDDKGAKACIMILNNNFGWGKDELARGQITQNNINITTNNVIQQKSTQELIEMIQGDLKYLEQNNVIDAEIVHVRLDEQDD